MKKLGVGLLVLLLTLTGCGGIKTVDVVSDTFGSFKLPEAFTKRDGYDSALLYSDEEDEYYFGEIYAEQVLFADGETYEDYIVYVREIIVPDLIAQFEDVEYGDPQESEIEVDGNRATRIQVHGYDDFWYDVISIELLKEGESVGMLVFMMDYSIEEYPDLGDLFLDTYKLPKE